MSIINPSNPNKSGGIGIPPGGTTGQVLTKKSDDDYDTYWGDVEGGSVAPPEEEGIYEWWSPCMTSDNSPAPYVASASTEVGVPRGYAYLAFNNNSSPNDRWHSDNGESWIKFDFGSIVTLKGMRMLPDSSAADTWRVCMPKIFTVEVSSDSSGWETVYIADGTQDYTPEIGEWMECHFDKPVKCQYVKLTETLAYNGSQYCCISEIEFYKLVTTAQLIAQQQQIRADIDFISVMTGVDLA